MEENKVIFRKPFDKRKSPYLENELKSIECFADEVRKNLGKNPFVDGFAVQMVRFRLEQLSKEWGFESFEDMNNFIDNFGVAALLGKE